MKTLFKPTFIALACFSSLALADANLNISTQSSGQAAISIATNPSKPAATTASVSQRMNARTFATTPSAMPEANAEPADDDVVSTPATVADKTVAPTKSSAEGGGELTLALTDTLAANDGAVPPLPELPMATLTDVIANNDAAGNASSALAVSSQVQGLAAGSMQVAQQTAGAVTANVTQSVQQQLQGSTTQMLQQTANAEVLQNVNQALNAEVSTTVRNSLRLTTGL